MLENVPYVASFSGLSFFITPSVFSNIYLSFVLCTLCWQFLWIVFFFITPSVFSQRNWQHKVHNTQDKYMLENTEGVIKQKTIQRNWQHRVYKTQDK
jgi:hypothetical protein